MLSTCGVELAAICADEVEDSGAAPANFRLRERGPDARDRPRLPWPRLRLRVRQVTASVVANRRSSRAVAPAPAPPTSVSVRSHRAQKTLAVRLPVVLSALRAFHRRSAPAALTKSIRDRAVEAPNQAARTLRASRSRPAWSARAPQHPWPAGPPRHPLADRTVAVPGYLPEEPRARIREQPTRPGGTPTAAVRSGHLAGVMPEAATATSAISCAASRHNRQKAG